MRAWRAQKSAGQCRYTQSCKRPSGQSYYCAVHRALFRENQNATRGLRRRLGFCEYCLVRAEPGVGRCRRHLILTRDACQRWRDKVAKQRGWKIVRVKI